MCPLGILSKLVCLLPSSTSPSTIPESGPHFAFHQWEGETSKDLPLLDRNWVTFIISSDNSSRWMYITCAGLEMQHWQAQIQTVLDYPKPLCIVLFPFNPSVPNSNSLKGCQQSSSHPCGNIQYSHWGTFWGVSSCSCPYLCGPKNQVCIRLLISAGESASLQPPNSADGHV